MILFTVTVLMVHPTAIGRMPQFSFISTVSLPPNKRLQTTAGVLPSRIRVINAGNAFKTLSAPFSAVQ